MEPKPKAACELNGLPAEILYLVFRLLLPVELRALCLVNKEIRALAEPFLYSTIQWNWLKAHPPAPFTQFLQTILCRPQLAAHITKVHLDGDNYQRPVFQRNIPKIPVSDAELDEPIGFIRRTGVPYSNLWIQELRQGTIDAFVALLLAQLPNLRTLYLGHNFTQQSALIGMVLRSAICEPVDYRLPNFQHLREVSFLLADRQDRARDKKVKNTADVLPFFYLPNLQSMSASIENPVAFTWPGAQSPVLCNLESLYLTRVREVYLGELLSVTQNLEILHWHWYFDSGVEDQFITQIVDLDRLAAAVSHVRGTLTDLTVSAKVSLGGGDQFNPAVMIVGSLHEMVRFDTIKRFQIPWALLMGFTKNTIKRLQDMIPRNIEFLVITDDLRTQNEDRVEEDFPEWEWTHSAIIDMLQLSLKDWRAYVPHLRRISLVISVLLYEPYDWCSTLTQRLRDLSAQTGVQVELINLTGR